MARIKKPRRLHLALLSVTKIRGQCAVVFGRVLLPDDAILEGYEVALVSPKEAADLAALLKGAEEDGDDLAAAGRS